MATLTLTADLQTVENGWTQARIVEFPDVITAAPSREQAIADVVDALELYLAAAVPQLARAAATTERVTLRLTLA